MQLLHRMIKLCQPQTQHHKSTIARHAWTARIATGNRLPVATWGSSTPTPAEGGPSSTPRTTCLTTHPHPHPSEPHHPQTFPQTHHAAPGATSASCATLAAPPACRRPYKRPRHTRSSISTAALRLPASPTMPLYTDWQLAAHQHTQPLVSGSCQQHTATTIDARTQHIPPRSPPPPRAYAPAGFQYTLRGERHGYLQRQPGSSGCRGGGRQRAAATS